jgi:hypothetical protein
MINIELQYMKATFHNIFLMLNIFNKRVYYKNIQELFLDQ